MADHTDTIYDTQVGQTYCLTSAGNCAATAVLNGTTVTLVSVSGGQSSFVAPTAKVCLVGAGVLTRCFKAAAPAVQGGGSTPVAAEPVFKVTGDSPTLPMQHAVWQVLPPTATAVTLTPTSATDRALTMVLVLTPAEDMPAGWLTADNGAAIVWLYGEPVFGKNYRYEVALTQTSPARIEARVTSITLA